MARKAAEPQEELLSQAQLDDLMVDLRHVAAWRFGTVTIEVVHGRVKRIQVMISKDLGAPEK